MIYLVVYLLNLLDLVLTHYAVTVWQVATEANFLMEPLLESWLIVFIKVVVSGAVLYMLWTRRHRKVTRVGIIFLLVLYIIVVINNGLVVLLHLLGWS